MLRRKDWLPAATGSGSEEDKSKGRPAINIDPMTLPVLQASIQQGGWISKQRWARPTEFEWQWRLAKCRAYPCAGCSTASNGSFECFPPPPLLDQPNARSVMFSMPCMRARHLHTRSPGRLATGANIELRSHSYRYFFSLSPLQGNSTYTSTLEGK